MDRRTIGGREYRIEIVDSRAKYEGLRSLWCEVFGDEPDYVDAVYQALGAVITGYVVIDEGEKICSALTCYRCGTMVLPVYVSYAICTAPECRGRGLAGWLTTYVRDWVCEQQGISLVSPAEPSLIKFYEGLGYQPCFGVTESIEYPDFDSNDWAEEERDDEGNMGVDPENRDSIAKRRSGSILQIEPDPTGSEWRITSETDSDYGHAERNSGLKISVNPLDPEAYGRYREEFLADIPHVRLNREMLEFIAVEYSLVLINNGDAVAAVNWETPETSGTDGVSKQLIVSELLVDPRLSELSSEIASEIACMLAGHYGCGSVRFRTPGTDTCQSMISASAGSSGSCAANDAASGSEIGLLARAAASHIETCHAEPDAGQEAIALPAYFGFPID